MNLYTKYDSVFKLFGIARPELVAQHWQEPHRYYHNEEHLAHLIGGIEQLYNKQQIDEEQRDTLLITAYFHDVIYDPTRNDNEERSADFFIQMADSHPNTQLVKEMILDTRNHEASSELSATFINLDMQVVSNSSFSELLAWERKIFKEYQYLDYEIYRQGRLDLLQNIKNKFPQNATNIQHLIDYLKTHRPNIGLYPGSFNPFHNGHLNILEKGEQIFDKVIVARGINPSKMDVNASELHLKVLKYRQTDTYSGFLTHYLTRKEGLANITLIRGLRNGDDLDYEVNQLRFMEDMKPDIKLIFITCDKEFEHISSTALKNLNKLDPDFSSRYTPN